MNPNLNGDHEDFDADTLDDTAKVEKLTQEENTQGWVFYRMNLDFLII